MSDPFAKFGIDHLSASSMNTYAACGAMWCLRYLPGLEYKDQVGPGAWRGSAVEAGLDWWIYNRKDDTVREDAITKAHARFEQDAQGEIRDDIDKARDDLTGFLDRAIELAASQYPEGSLPDARQLKFEYRIEGIEVPIIGYMDYVWPGAIDDLKTTYRMPSEISSEHGRQIALYSTVKQRRGRLLYVTPKKSQVMELTPDQVEAHMRYLTRCAHSIRALLAMCPDAPTAASMFVPNLDHNYLWKSEAAKQAAQTYWS
jgi:ribosomal 50S subunit-associated protein YjgA (DUF615 family)